MFLLSGGAAIQTLLLGLHAQGIASLLDLLHAVLPAGDARRARRGRGVVRAGQRGVRPDADRRGRPAPADDRPRRLRGLVLDPSKRTDVRYACSRADHAPVARPSPRSHDPQGAPSVGEHEATPAAAAPRRPNARNRPASSASGSSTQMAVEAPQPQHRPRADRARRRGDRAWWSFVVQPGGAPTRRSRPPQALLASAAADGQVRRMRRRAARPRNYRQRPRHRPRHRPRPHRHRAGRLTAPPLSQYPTIPPASGPHDPTPLPAGVYDRPPDIYATHPLAGARGRRSSGTRPSAAELRRRASDQGLLRTERTRTSASPRSSWRRTTTPTRAQRARCPAACRWRSSRGTACRPARTPSLAVAFDFTSQYSNGLPRPDLQGRRRASRASL